MLGWKTRAQTALLPLLHALTIIYNLSPSLRAVPTATGRSVLRPRLPTPALASLLCFRPISITMSDDERVGPPEAAGDAEMAEASGESSSGSDFEELDVSAEDAALLMRLEQALADNPTLYDSHVQVRRRRRRPVPPAALVCVLSCCAACFQHLLKLGRISDRVIILTRCSHLACPLNAVHRSAAALQDGGAAAGGSAGHARCLPAHRGAVVSEAAGGVVQHQQPGAAGGSSSVLLHLQGDWVGAAAPGTPCAPSSWRVPCPECL